MNVYQENVGRSLIVELPGTKQEGVLVDYGEDITVLYNGQKYLYIPVKHIRSFRLNPLHNKEQVNSAGVPFPLTIGNISYREILNEAKNLFIEIAVVGNVLTYGTIADILDDYFIFVSPVYQTLLVPIEHLKWLALVNRNQSYYSLSREAISMVSQCRKPAAKFKEQLKRLEGKFILLDMGNNPYKIGLLKSVNDETLQLITAEDEAVFYSIRHLQVLQIA